MLKIDWTRMKYVDGFIIAVKRGKLEEYKKMAKLAGRVWKKYGDLEYVETVQDDMNPKIFTGIKFTKTVRAKPGEKVIFSFIIFKSRKHRDEVNAKVMKYFEKEIKNEKDKPMPFDMKRFVY